tara:strand:+ start:158 stop:439 length:282 start_codon:yes stop_codon:yes gene_type:complete
MAARDAEAMPFPKEETTPPVTKIKRVIEGPQKRDLEVKTEGQAPPWRLPEPSLKMGGQNTRRGYPGKTKSARIGDFYALADGVLQQVSELPPA